MLGWVGVAGLVTCGTVLDVGAAFPGYLALWPVLSAVAIIVGGPRRAAPTGCSPRAPPSTWAAISFPLYLWHWPVLVVFLVLAGHPSAGPVGGLVVVAVSVALAIATHHLLEEPLRGVSLTRLGRVRAPAIVAACLVPALVALGVWSAIAAAGAGAPVALGDPSHPGALALQRAGPRRRRRPRRAGASRRWRGCRTTGRSTGTGAPRWPTTPCSRSACRSAPRASRSAGSPSSATPTCSSSCPALEPLAREQRWEVRTLVRARCPFSTTSETDPGDASCIEWNEAAIEHLAAAPPDAVVVSASRDVRPGLTEQTPEGFVAAWQRLDAAGVPVVAVRDNPRFDHRPAECLERYGRGAPDCEVPRGELLAADPPVRAPRRRAGRRRVPRPQRRALHRRRPARPRSATCSSTSTTTTSRPPTAARCPRR